MAYLFLTDVFNLAEILDSESGEEDLKLALNQLRDDQISQSLVIPAILECAAYFQFLLYCFTFVTRSS